MIRKLLFLAFPVLHPIKTRRHFRAARAPWPPVPEQYR